MDTSRISGYFFARLLTPCLGGCFFLILIFTPCRAQINPETNSPQTTGSSRQTGAQYNHIAVTNPAPKVPRGYRFGAVLQFLGNPFDQAISLGLASMCHQNRCTIEIGAGASQSDQEGQRAMLESMLGREYDVLFISPQNSENLISALTSFRGDRPLLININQALLDGADLYVGPEHRAAGTLLADFVQSRLPAGGEIAIIRGQGMDSAEDAFILGFTASLDDTLYPVVANPLCLNDLQLALQITQDILQDHPELRVLVCLSDIMALGALEAVEISGKQEQVLVLGRDGIPQAIQSVRDGNLSATIQSYPYQMGQTAVDIAFRKLAGQKIPPVVTTPQDLVTPTSFLPGEPLERKNKEAFGPQGQLP